MKNFFKNCFILFSIILGEKAYTQTEIQLDFLSDTILQKQLNDKIKELEYNKTYVVKISNINRSLYTINNTITQEDYNIKVPEIFKDIKLPSYLNMALPDKAEIEQLEQMSPSTEGNILKEYTNELSNLKDLILKYESIQLLNNDFKNFYLSCDEDYETIKGKLIVKVQEFTNDITNNDRKYQEKKLKLTIEEVLSGIKISLEKLQGSLPKVIDFYEDEIISIKTAIHGEELGEPSKTKVEEHKEWYKNKITLESRLNSKNTVVEKQKAQISKNLEILIEVKKFKEENKLQALIDNYNIINESNFAYESGPFKIKKDEVKLDIKIISENLLKCDRQNEVLILKSLKTKGGLKVDFSSGLFVNGGNDDFLGRQLLYKSVNDSTTTIQSKDGGDRLLLSIGALMHIYYRNGRKVNWAISPGLSTTSEFDGLNFHLGASAIFGRKNRLVLTLGTTMREAKILDRNYSYDIEYPKSEVPESPPTIKVFPKFGWFLSLTYNFSKFESN